MATHQVHDNLNMNNTREVKPRQRGATLVLLALVIAPLLLVIALAIDGSLLLASKAELQTKADRMALTALGRYSSTYRLFMDTSNPQACAACSGSQTTCATICASEAARIGAEAVARSNISIGEKFTEQPLDRIDTVDLGESAESSSPNPEIEGLLQVGEYFWHPPCGCVQGSVCEPADNCLQSYPGFLQKEWGEQAVNSLRVTLRFKPSNSLLARIAVLAGFKEFEFSASSTSALLPRNDFFLIDLSRSMIRDNYRHSRIIHNEVPIPGTRSNYAFQMKPEFPCPNWGASVSHPLVCCPAGGQGCTDADPACFVTDWMIHAPADSAPQDHYIFDQLYGSASQAPPLFLDSAIVPPAVRHYSTHYTCFGVDIDSDSIEEPYLIDWGGLPSGPMKARPEPLFSIMDAANHGLKLIGGRAMSVDRTALFGFDSLPLNTESLLSVPPTRVMPPTQPLAANPLFAAWLNATNTAPSFVASPTDGLIKKGMFPTPNAFSDLFQALRLSAFAISQQYSYKIAKNSIVLFTDGLQNCLYQFDPNASNIWNKWTLQQTVPCKNVGSYLKRGIDLLGDPEFVSEFSSRQIAVSVVMIGSDVMPHYVVRKSTSGHGCRNQIEDLAQGSPSGAFVDADLGFFQSPATTDAELDLRYTNRATVPFYYPNVLYQTLVAPTNGLWVPLMPPYQYVDPVDPATKFNVDFRQQLEEACNNADITNPVLSNLSLNVTQNGVDITINDVTDSNGRLKYHPGGYSPATQLQYAMELIIQSPYVLVP